MTYKFKIKIVKDDYGYDINLKAQDEGDCIATVDDAKHNKDRVIRHENRIGLWR